MPFSSWAVVLQSAKVSFFVHEGGVDYNLRSGDLHVVFIV